VSGHSVESNRDPRDPLAGSYLLCVMDIWTSLKEIILSQKASLVAQMVNNLPAMLETQVESMGQEDPIE